MPRRLLAVLAGAAALAAGAVAAGPAAAAPTWAPAATATIHPGVQLLTDGAQCTANFVFADATDVYLGQAAHCSGTGAATDTGGCTSASLPIGTPVDITGADHPGTLVYNSWLTMQSLGETDPDTCAFNDLALVRIDPADDPKVNPSTPFWGGPTGVSATGTRSATRSSATALRAARRRERAEPEGGDERRRRRRRLVAHGLHRHARHPR
jgi:hypothetical protein